jgi:PAS domain S-box-containing protein
MVPSNIRKTERGGGRGGLAARQEGGPGIDSLDIVASTADPAFATDEEGRIVIWNRAAERLLGHSPAHVLGRACHEVLCGTDSFENRFCDESCALRAMARRREPVRRFEMHLRTEGGVFVRVAISVVVIPGPRSSQYTVVHLVQPAAVESGAPTPSGEGPAVDPTVAAHPAPPAHVLTDREVDVLRRLASGGSTQEIADSLFISITTVRNHVQNILRKLEVHSKLEAVSLALRRRLI